MPQGTRGRATCTIEGCDKIVNGRGLCPMHYQRWRNNGDPHVVIVQVRPVCSVEGCERLHEAHGLCELHYKRLRANGTTDPRRRPTAEERFWPRVEKTETCWLWTGPDNGAGYGSFGFGGRGRRVLAHRWLWEQTHGPVPAGLELDHLCRTPRCVNPEHLEPVTHTENMRRAGAAITHCPAGHVYDEANTRHRRGTRECRTCERDKRAERRLQAKSAPR